MGLVEAGRLPEIEPKPGWHGRFFHSAHMTFAYYRIDAGAALPPHSHENEEVWHVIAGALDMRLGESAVHVGAGSAVVVPANVVHAVDAHEACSAIVVDYPLRGEVAGIRL